MTKTPEQIITQTINDLRAIKHNDVLIAVDLLGVAVPVLLQVAGTKQTESFLRDFADKVADLETPPAH